MAATLTGAGELTYASFPIDKVETDADGDLVVYGKASDGSVDSDQQVVAPTWMKAAGLAWKESGANLRVMHNAQRDPAGIGLEIETDSSGATWVKGLVVEPIAKKLVAKGALRAYSVGIARPTIERDPTGKARGGIITGGELVEISLVDRPANKQCGIQLVKAADDGTPEYVGKVFGADDAIAKALGADVTKGADDDLVNVDLPRGASISISPADFAKLHTFKQQLVTKGTVTAEATAKRDVSPADPLDDSDSTSKGTVTETAAKNASDGDVLNAAMQTAMPAVDAAVKEAEPEVTKDPEQPPADPKDRPVKKAKNKKKKLPPWLNKPDDSGSDDDSGDDGACKSVTDHLWTASVTWSPDGPVNEVSCSKCKTTPAEAAGLSGTHDMTCAPVPDLLESPPMASTKGSPTPQSASGAGEAPSMTPVPQHREPDGAIVEPFEKDANLPAQGQGETPTRLEAGMMKSSPEVAAILRFKRAGMDIELGRLHDLTCPAFHPEDVAKCHPFSDLSRIDVDAFQREAVKAACGPDLERSKSLTMAWQAAHVLRGADPAELNDFRMAAHKAFRDANPGPSSAPTPGSVSPGKYNRPLITDGHEASSPAHDGPNSSPQVATNAPNAHSFDRPPLSAGHQSPSPSFMKASFEYPSEQGRPVQLNYAVMEKERARHALMQMHEHLSRQFPEACPMDLDAPPVQPESRGVPPTAGIGKGAEGFVTATGVNPSGVLVSDLVKGMAPVDPRTAPAEPIRPVAAILKAPAEGELVDDAVYKGFKKARKRLGKKVLAGSMTVDEARAKLGRQFAQKGGGEDEVTAAVQKSAAPAAPPAPVAAALIPDLIKAAVREALHVESVPLEAATIEAFDPSPAIEAAVTKAVTPLLEKIQAQDTKLAETQRVIDAIADQPDPSTAAFSGLAFNPLRNKAAGPAGVPSQAEIAERTQLMMMRTLQDKYNASSDPAEREAYYGTLAKMRGYSGQ